MEKLECMKNSPHEYRLQISETTKVIEQLMVNPPILPPEVFVKLRTIPSLDDESFVDVIGVVKNIGPLGNATTFRGIRKRLVVTIDDSR